VFVQAARHVRASGEPRPFTLSYAARSAIMVGQIVAAGRARVSGRQAHRIREVAVPAYVMLANWTDQGARQVKDSPKRLDAAKKALVEMGGEFKTIYMTMGDYDLIVVYEAPDDAVAARFTLLLAQMGSVRTRTLKAFPEAAYREIINSLG
jgi:uncharacterized protein with GYD domain